MLVTRHGSMTHGNDVSTKRTCLTTGSFEHAGIVYRMHPSLAFTSINRGACVCVCGRAPICVCMCVRVCYRSMRLDARATQAGKCRCEWKAFCHTLSGGWAAACLSCVYCCNGSVMENPTCQKRGVHWNSGPASNWHQSQIRGEPLLPVLPCWLGKQWWLSSPTGII